MLPLIWHQRRWLEERVFEFAAHDGVGWSIVPTAFVAHARTPMGASPPRAGEVDWALNPDTKRWLWSPDGGPRAGRRDQRLAEGAAGTLAGGITQVSIDLLACYAKAHGRHCRTRAAWVIGKAGALTGTTTGERAISHTKR